jgi:protein TonB
MTSIHALEWEDRYYAVALRVATVAALVLTTLAFLVLPREFVVNPYQLRRSVETIMEALPPSLEKLAEPPAATKPVTVPVAAASEAEVEASTVGPTTFQEVIRRTDETDVPIVPFWRVEIKPQPISIPTPTYPDLARQANVEGQTVVEALVGTDGSVADARVLKSSGNASLDQSAVDAALKARFSPAKQRDQPVRVWVSIPFRFTLN